MTSRARSSILASAALYISLQNPCVAQQLGLHGSFVIAAICKDGIVVASESRANIFDTTDPRRDPDGYPPPIAYYDGIQKIFLTRGKAIAETGQGLIGNRFFSSIVSDFAAVFPASVPTANLLPEFFQYCRRVLSSLDMQVMQKQLLFGAGFDGDVPEICYFNQVQPEGPFGCITSGFIESDHTTFAAHAKDLHSLSGLHTAELAKEAIRSYAAQGDRWKKMGGTINILLLTKTGNTWLENAPPRQAWIVVADLIKAYQSKKAVITPIPPATKQTLEDLFATVR